jgi:endonuclease I
MKCNSLRNNWPYGDFSKFSQETVREGCGDLEQGRFEPMHGKGIVARAALYFLIRYPSKILNRADRYTPASIDMFRAWHNRYPVSDYERHRNATIFAKQGNRNPLIDFPEWADHIDVSRGLG